ARQTARAAAPREDHRALTVAARAAPDRAQFRVASKRTRAEASRTPSEARVPRLAVHGPGGPVPVRRRHAVGCVAQATAAVDRACRARVLRPCAARRRAA